MFIHVQTQIGKQIRLNPYTHHVGCAGFCTSDFHYIDVTYIFMLYGGLNCARGGQIHVYKIYHYCL